MQNIEYIRRYRYRYSFARSRTVKELRGKYSNIYIERVQGLTVQAGTGCLGPRRIAFSLDIGEFCKLAWWRGGIVTVHGRAYQGRR